MKVFLLYLLFLSMLAVSCHKKSPDTRLSCCARDHAIGRPSTLSPALTDGSIYRLPGNWTDQHDRSFSLGELKGKVQVVAMIFTHCGYACPRIVADMKNMEDSLPAALSKNVDFVLVSFDSDRDTPARLHEFAAEEHLDNHWTLLHGGKDQVRELSMLLDVKYQRLPDGNFAHSNVVVLLNKEGEMVRHDDATERNAGLAVTTIRQLLDR
ncbi:MAG: SCO family protein [Bacteroidota bacterium]|nr:SCO family protein [Bacteroidota bacterium]MDP4216625.1 SCO family protein [Bacteroidota bacterium]MDP4246951.1 SCO family protein [Bacteroidota bacterium]MDP4260539.1 SCO family protein [Bacteroidota bacterium]